MSQDASRFSLLRELAAGPNSAVFLGLVEDGWGSRRVALKLLRELPAGGVATLLDLRDEARRIHHLGHHGIVAMTQVARVDERFALVSPFISGIDLLDWVGLLTESGRVLPRRVTCEIIADIAHAIEAAATWPPSHGAPPLARHHQALKPSNVIIGRDGQVYVTDFGTGSTLLAGEEGAAEALKQGLLRYMSPQRRDGAGRPDADDVYALGIIAIELLRGRWLRRVRVMNPAHDRQFADIVARLEDLQTRSEGDARSLRSLILRMVAHDEDARPSITEVRSTFRALADRIDGPSLSAFAIDHVAPWIEVPPAEPDEELRQASALVVERDRPVPPPGGGLDVKTKTDRYAVESPDGETDDWADDEVTDPRAAESADAHVGIHEVFVDPDLDRKLEEARTVVDVEADLEEPTEEHPEPIRESTPPAVVMSHDEKPATSGVPPWVIASLVVAVLILVVFVLTLLALTVAYLATVST